MKGGGNIRPWNSTHYAWDSTRNKADENTLEMCGIQMAGRMEVGRIDREVLSCVTQMPIPNDTIGQIFTYEIRVIPARI